MPHQCDVIDAQEGARRASTDKKRIIERAITLIAIIGLTPPMILDGALQPLGSWRYPAYFAIIAIVVINSIFMGTEIQRRRDYYNKYPRR